jgi:hypothetical protein
VAALCIVVVVELYCTGTEQPVHSTTESLFAAVCCPVGAAEIVFTSTAKPFVGDTGAQFVNVEGSQTLVGWTEVNFCAEAGVGATNSKKAPATREPKNFVILLMMPTF